MLRKISLNQSRGSWIAYPGSEIAKDLLGFSAVPVMRDYDNGEFVWGKAPVKFHVTLETSKDTKTAAWWMKTTHAEWRRLLEAGCPVLIRKGEGSDTGHGKNTVGRKIGVFKTNKVTISPSSFYLELTEKLFECG